MTSTQSHTAMITLATVAAACSNPGLLAQSDVLSATTPVTLRFDALSMPIDRLDSSISSSDQERVPHHQLRTSLGALNELETQAESTDGWAFMLSPYLYLPGIEGDTSIAGTTAEIDVSFSDIFSDFDVLAFSLRFEAWKDDQWGLIFDGMFLDLDGEFDFPGPPDKISVDIFQSQVDFGLGYRLVDQDMGADDPEKSRLLVDVIGGMRYQYFKQKLKIDADPTLGGSADWLEIFIGGRVVYEMNEKWAFAVRGDAGGFGIGSASELTWNLLAGFEYQFKETQSIRLGYKVQGFDYSSGTGASQFGADWTTQGLYLAMAFTF